MATLTLKGLYLWDNDILAGLQVPTGTMTYDDGTTITEPVADRNLLIDNILLESYNLELIYPDFRFLQTAIYTWCRKESTVWVEYWKTLHYRYNPIHNYDRTEDGTDKQTRDLKTTDNDTHNLQLDKTDTHDLTLQKNGKNTVDNTITYGGNDALSRDVAGYNSSSLTARDKETTNYNSNDKTDETVLTEETTTDTGTLKFLTKDTGTLKRDGTDTGTITDKHDLRAYGNIGVTSTQELIKQQREIIDTNMIDFITTRFIDRFCLEVY